MNADLGDYNFGMVCYSPTNLVSILGKLMVGSGCGVGVENVITMAALSRRVDVVGGSVMVWDGISYHHQTALRVCRSRMNAIYYPDNDLRNDVIHFFHQY